MRDQEISLPLTESLQAIKRELAYFGLWLGDNDNDNNGDDLSSKITIGTPAEAGAMIASIGDNMNEELDELDKDIIKFNKKIQERRLQKLPNPCLTGALHNMGACLNLEIPSELKSLDKKS